MVKYMGFCMYLDKHKTKYKMKYVNKYKYTYKHMDSYKYNIDVKV